MNGTDDLDHVRDVLSRHRDRLMALEGVTGTGIGAGAEGTGYAIVVYLSAPSGDSSRPSEIDGVAIRYVVTGAFRPQNRIAKPKD